MKIDRGNIAPPPIPRVGEEPGFKFRYLFYLAAVILLGVAVCTRNPQDDVAQLNQQYSNWGGHVGAVLSKYLFYLFGFAVYVLLAIMLLWIVRQLFFRLKRRNRFYKLGVVLLVLGSMLICAYNPRAFNDSIRRHININNTRVEAAPTGGIPAQLLVAPREIERGGNRELVPQGWLRQQLGTTATLVLILVMCVGGLWIIYFIDWHPLLVRRLSGESEPAEEPKPTGPAGLDDPALAAASGQLRYSHATYPQKNSSNLNPNPNLSNVRAVPSAPAKAVEATKDIEVPDLPIFADDDTDGNTAGIPESVAVKTGAGTPHSTLLQKVKTLAKPSTQNTSSGVVVPVKPAAKTPAAPPVKGGATFKTPDLTMLGKGEEVTGEDTAIIAANKDKIQRILDTFHFKGQVANHISGPRLTQYEIEVAPEVMPESLTRFEKKLAMVLEASSLRILAPIPGRDVCGLQVPNRHCDAICMRQIMEKPQWQNTHAQIPIALGLNLSGEPVILDLAKAPHLLIAGSTGSGKSVCMNTLIMSMLLKFRPDELKLIMVDPKVVEFADYQTLPHLITPVINDSPKVPIALRWAVNEMEHRYRLLAKAGVKKLSEYNSRPPSAVVLTDEDGQDLPDTLPILVVIIDELADLMLTEARKDVENSISRIAAKGRAGGVHIVVATQRPDVKVITGTIKANLPTRIAFRVGSGMDSRVILDQVGAEKLLGMGDMLYLPPGSSQLERAQGAFVADEDIKSVVQFISAQAPQEFNEAVVAAPEADEELSDGESDNYRNPGEDPLDDDLDDDIRAMIGKYSRPEDPPNFKKALEILFTDRKASISYLQRRLRVGYNQAANLIDEMEERGIVGPQVSGGGQRQILVFDDILNDPDL